MGPSTGAARVEEQNLRPRIYLRWSRKLLPRRKPYDGVYHVPALLFCKMPDPLVLALRHPKEDAMHIIITTEALIALALLISAIARL